MANENDLEPEDWDEEYEDEEEPSVKAPRPPTPEPVPSLAPTLAVKPVPQKGHWDAKYAVWRQSDDDGKRDDLSRERLYLVRYNGTWLIGRFAMQWYGWNFRPNMGSMSMQIESLELIYEIEGLDQKEAGDTASFILGYLFGE